MQYVTSLERQAIERGRQQGLEQGLEQGLLQKAQEDVLEILQIRFEQIPEALAEAINSIDNLSRLKRLLKEAVISASIAQFEQIVAEEIPPDQPDEA